jgi:hypothetical protein
MQCHFCGTQFSPQAYSASYGQPPPPPGAPPMGYGQPPMGYGQPPMGYGQPPNPYGPYGYPPPYVQPIVYGNPYRSASAWTTFFWVRLVIAAIAIGISLLGACISALSH